ncbi:MAG TPA: SIR2 family protein [Thermoanaerobaculia bacterium]|nr:SIR2 family protein [Thermoanaerobaculia bacterium]
MSSAVALSDLQADGWSDGDWEGLLLSIKFKQCTPFLGAGACAGLLPLGRDIAQKWADDYDYPFEDRTSLVRVAQYVADHRGPRVPKFKMAEALTGCKRPDFSDPFQIHRAVADLPLPVYITTNYDDFMMEAFKHSVPGRTARREVCRWHTARRRFAPQPVETLNATVDAPVVFHLHGVLDEVDSMVLTEDDYLDFLMAISELPDLIPPRIERAFVDSTLLFLGYSLEDMNFKVLFRRLVSYIQRNSSASHVAVQLAPYQNETTAEQLARARRQQSYLERHLDLQKVKVYWGTCAQFAAELRRRWEIFNHGR